ncbi:uncharacterized protein ACOB8E_006107 isoform 2-T3 [Sarcophilus harrisii]
MRRSAEAEAVRARLRSRAPGRFCLGPGPLGRWLRTLCGNEAKPVGVSREPPQVSSLRRLCFIKELLGKENRVSRSAQAWKRRQTPKGCTCVACVGEEAAKELL